MPNTYMPKYYFQILEHCAYDADDGLLILFLDDFLSMHTDL